MHCVFSLSIIYVVSLLLSAPRFDTRPRSGAVGPACHRHAADDDVFNPAGRNDATRLRACDVRVVRDTILPVLSANATVLAMPYEKHSGVGTRVSLLTAATGRRAAAPARAATVRDEGGGEPGWGWRAARRSADEDIFSCGGAGKSSTSQFVFFLTFFLVVWKIFPNFPNKHGRICT